MVHSRGTEFAQEEMDFHPGYGGSSAIIKARDRSGKKWGRADVRKKTGVLLLAAALLIAGCRGGAGEENPESAAPPQQAGSSGEETAYGRLPQQVTLKIPYKIVKESTKLADGDSYEDNPIYRYLEESLNMKLSHVWESRDTEGAVTQKINLAIASNDIPDAMMVNPNQLRVLVEKGMIEDLTDVYDRYASDLIKNIHDSTQGASLESARFGGRLMALPNVSIEADSPYLLWVRQDWLTKLGLAPPKTADDIARIARAFIERDPDGNGRADTLGLSGDKYIVLGQKAGLHAFDSVFSANGAFPKAWVRDKDGNVVYGSLTPQTKEVLAKLAGWYKEGIIEKDFPLRGDGGEVVAANQVGIHFGAWWSPWYPHPDSIKNDPKAEWIAVRAPLDADGRFTVRMAPVADQFIVVRKGYKHPEAVMKLLNTFTRLERGEDPNTEQAAAIKEYESRYQIDKHDFYPFNMILDYADAVGRKTELLERVAAGELKKEDMKTDEMRQNYDAVLSDLTHPKKDLTAYSVSRAYLQGGRVLNEGVNGVYSLFTGQTPTMESRWAALDKLENDTFLRIVTGEAPVDSFDSFVKKWKELGGEQITREVTEAVKLK
ncbi:extracellular solute-binding protein [Paenibacillus mucilaginosus]|uniref:extracellular solute-binding protein n=1 Tax=Paenibacillus mucilaginosus TaxID=61624 RepID=UPI003D1C0EC3